MANLKPNIIEAQDGRSGSLNQSLILVTQVSLNGTFTGRGGRVLYLVILLVAVTYSRQYIHSRWMSFEMVALPTKNLMSGTAPCEVTDALINSIMVIVLECVCLLNHHIVHFEKQSRCKT